ncbi:MAG: hypothetical protein IAG13_29085, partial [Deltaproteobacteria bacterium]|nr:hypothetical protein [Nannocystaceae bacterium]
LVLAMLGGTAALLARSWGHAHPSASRAVARDERDAPLDASLDPDPDAREPLPLLVLIGGTGLVGVGFEVIGVLVLSQLFENTIYTFANVLAVYLGGTALGAWAWGRLGPRLAKGRPSTALAALLIALALSVVVAAFAVVAAPDVLAWVAPAGSSFSTHLLGESAVALTVFAVPTMLMGALFSHAMGLVAPGGLGYAYAINTLGGAIAPFVFGVWAPISLGYRDAFFSVAYGYLLVFGVFTWYRRFKPAAQIGSILAVIGATVLAPSTLLLVEPDPQWKTIAEHQTPLGLVSVSERIAADANAPMPKDVVERRLHIGKLFRMGGGVAIGERRLGQLPLVLHGAPRTALFLGVGTGATLGAVRSFDSLVHVDAVELVPAVIAELHQFDSINAEVRKDGRVQLHAADARRFVAAARQRWDVVVADLFHPGLDGAGSLYAREHFTEIAEHLEPGGVFVQWLPLYQLDDVPLRAIIGAFLDVFPEGEAWLGVYNAERPALALVARGSDGVAPID